MRQRLPMIQHIGERIADNFQATLTDRDSLRKVRTSQTQIATGPLHPLQIFAYSGPGYTNTPESMSSGLMIANAPRLANKNRGQSAGT
jgi:hypothetical protein